MLLAINPGGATQQLPGTKTTDPAFGLPAVWIDERHRETAQMAGFTVVDCATVVATHLSHLMQVNAAKLLGRVETQALVEHVTKLAPKLIEDVVPKMVGIATLQKVLQLLLEEGVHIRDMRSIVECLAEHAATVTDPVGAGAPHPRAPGPGHRAADLRAGEGARRDRARPELERLVTQALTSPHGAALDPGVAETLSRSAADTAQRQEDLGVPACLLVPDLIRAPMARLLKRAAPRLKVLGHSEIPDTHSIRIGSIIGARHERQAIHRPHLARRLALVRQAFGDDAVVLSTRPAPKAWRCWRWRPESVQQLERVSAAGPHAAAPGAPPGSRAPARNGARPAHHRASVDRGRRAAGDEHAVVPGLRARAHAQAPPSELAQAPAAEADAATPCSIRRRRCRRAPVACPRRGRRRVRPMPRASPRPAAPRARRLPVPRRCRPRARAGDDAADAAPTWPQRPARRSAAPRGPAR
jgi:hypothetical protein